jgi:TonB family protein
MALGRAFVVVVALVGVAACARQERPVASTAATSAAAPSARGPTAERAEEPSSLGSVRPGNQRPLKSAAVPFATYLNKVHNRIHPEFTDKGLEKLDALPPTHPMNDVKLVVRVEIVIEGQTGLIRNLVVVRSSGLAEFDALAVESVRRAGPFDDAPPEIRSSDGNVYVHWQFMRDEVFACSTMHVRPFLLSLPASGPPPASFTL